MERKELFLHMVQSASVVEDIRTGREIAASVLEGAEEIDSSCLPEEDLAFAVREYIRYQYSNSPYIQPPTWLK